jgi:uncharacterized protein YlxW (UPF0749 family)
MVAGPAMQIPLRRPVKARPRLPALIALVVGFASLPVAAQAQSVDSARRALDAVAVDYMRAEEHVRRLDEQIAAIGDEIESARHDVAAARRVVAARAVDLYTGDGADLTTWFGSGDAIDAARRSELVGTANSDTLDAIDHLDAQTAALEARRAELSGARDDQERSLATLRQRRSELAGLLAAAQAAYERRAAERRAASAPSTTATAATTGSPAPTTDPAARAADPPAPRTVAAPPPPTSGAHPHHDDPFLVCTRERESHGDYRAVNPAGYYGAYQMSPSTWDSAAAHGGRGELIGVRPDRASVYDQDDVAWTLYQWQGKAPWLGRC